MWENRMLFYDILQRDPRLCWLASLIKFQSKKNCRCIKKNTSLSNMEFLTIIVPLVETRGHELRTFSKAVDLSTLLENWGIWKVVLRSPSQAAAYLDCERKYLTSPSSACIVSQTDDFLPGGGGLSGIKFIP